MPSDVSQQQLAILASLISEYVLDNGIADADDARAVAQRIYTAGFRMTGSDQSITSRLATIEQRISALEGWSGLSRNMILNWEDQWSQTQIAT